MRRWATLLAAVSALLLLPMASADAADDIAFSVEDPAIAAPTGFAFDVETERYWMVRESGPGEVVAVNTDGKVDGVTGFGAETQQVQALADDADRLFIGDIGDRDRNREFVTVYFLTNAEPDAGDGTYGAFDLAYPDGPHDAKAMFVRSGRIYLVTNGDDPGIYAAPQQPDRSGVNQLERLGDAPANVTDAAVMGDGQVVLRTYTSLHVLDGDGAETGASELPWQQQGETVARDADDDANVLIGDSADPVQVMRVAIPDEIAEVAEAPAEPPASPGEVPAEGPAEGGEVATPSGQGAARTGTFVALGLAALVALVAGVIVFRAKTPAGADLRPRVSFTERPAKGRAVWRSGEQDPGDRQDDRASADQDPEPSADGHSAEAALEPAPGADPEPVEDEPELEPEAAEPEAPAVEEEPAVPAEPEPAEAATTRSPWAPSEQSPAPTPAPATGERAASPRRAVRRATFTEDDLDGDDEDLGPAPWEREPADRPAWLPPESEQTETTKTPRRGFPFSGS